MSWDSSHTKADVTRETSTVHTLRVVLDELLLDAMSTADEVRVVFVSDKGDTNAKRLTYSDMVVLKEGRRRG